MTPSPSPSGTPPTRTNRAGHGATRPKTITVTLTLKQAECLLSVASQALERSEGFADRRDWNAAAQAHDKIQSALHP